MALWMKSAQDNLFNTLTSSLNEHTPYYQQLKDFSIC